MYAHGLPIYDPHGVSAGIVLQAREAFAAGRDVLAAHDLFNYRCLIWDRMRVLEKLAVKNEREPEFSLVAGHFIFDLLEAFWALRKMWSPEPGRAMTSLREREPQLALQIERILDLSAPVSLRMANARNAALNVFGAEAFSHAHMKGPLVHNGY
jgi:hypothetical protein